MYGTLIPASYLIPTQHNELHVTTLREVTETQIQALQMGNINTGRHTNS